MDWKQLLKSHPKGALTPHVPEDLVNRLFVAERLVREGRATVEEASYILGTAPDVAQEVLIRQGVIAGKTILVCGGAGFIGSNFVHHILKKYPHYRVINFDKLTYAGNLDNLRNVERNPRYEFVQGDIADAETIDAVFQKQVDAVVNFAAETHVGRSVYYGTKEFVHTNVLGVTTLLEAVRKYKTPRFVQISTDEVYGELELSDTRSFTEESPFLPNVPYAAAKAGGDLMCRAYWESYKTPVIVTHCTNNFGPYQHPEKLIPYSIFRASANQPLTIHGDGQHVRDWIFVLDHAEALDRVLHKGKPGEVYNIGAGNEIPVIDIARLILNLLGKPSNLVAFVPDRPGNDIRYSIDVSKSKRELGWEPGHTFEEAMPKTISWYQANHDWVERVREKDKQSLSYTI